MQSGLLFHRRVVISLGPPFGTPFIVDGKTFIPIVDLQDIHILEALLRNLVNLGVIPEDFDIAFV